MRQQELLSWFVCFLVASREQEKIAFPDAVFKNQDEKVPEREREVS